MLFVYAAGFSFTYINLPAASGALLLFGAVQATMIAYSIWLGERFDAKQIIGLLLAFGGLLGLLAPGLSAPPLLSALLMLSAGMAWGFYSIRGKSLGDPTKVTAGNFMRAAPMAALTNLLMLSQISVDSAGIVCAIFSGALTSGIGYVIWYAALPALKASSAAAVQLSVPIIATLGGIVFLGESLTLRVVLASITILGGIALFIAARKNV